MYVERVNNMTLREFFELICPQLGLDVDDCLAYADEDVIGGFNMDVNERRWPTGSLWEVEGKVLYALVRAMKPRNVLEIGTWVGCSATHILEALAVNGKGKLTSIDVNGGAGSQIPLSLRKKWSLLEGQAQDVISNNALPHVDLVYEDGPHDLAGTQAILEAVRDNLTPKLVISHDGMHFLVGNEIRTAYYNTFGENPQGAIIEPSDCGFAWRIGGAE
jgi:hypothetical protein